MSISTSEGSPDYMFFQKGVFDNYNLFSIFHSTKPMTQTIQAKDIDLRYLIDSFGIKSDRYIQTPVKVGWALLLRMCTL